MPRVIKEKAMPELEVLCRDSCGALIGYYPNEVREVKGRDISGGPDGCKYIECPSCGKRIILETW